MEELSYLKRTEPLYLRDPNYDRSRSYDVVHCGTCGKSEIEPEITKCDACGQDVCPYCAGTVPGYHEICRRDVDGEIDPLLDRKAFELGVREGCDLRGAATTRWFPYWRDVFGEMANPGVGKWCLWSFVTKHGRGYYGGARFDDDLLS